MKKIFIAAAVLLLLSGCKDAAEVQSGTVAAESAETSAHTEISAETVTETFAETVTTTSAETVTATETTADEREYMTGEKSLLKLIEFLRDGAKDCITFNYHGNASLPYDFMDGFTIDSYSYEHRGDGVYDLTLTCSDSSCDIFPNGDSYWYVNTNRHGNFLFCSAERENEVMISTEYPMPLEETVELAYRAASRFTLVTGAFEADSEWFENYTDIDVHGFYHSPNPYCVIHEYDEETGETEFFDVTPEAFAAAVKKLYNVNMTAEQARLMTDETGFMTKNCGHGGTWYYDTFAGYEETENEIRVRVNYCGDDMYFYPVIQSEYTFSKNGDGTITLQKIEKFFDRGYEPAWDSI